MQLNSTMRLISGNLRSTPLPWLPVLSNIEPPALRRKAATDKLVEKIVKHDSWPIQPHILSTPFLRLTSRKPSWLDLQPESTVKFFSEAISYWVSRKYYQSLDTKLRWNSLDRLHTVAAARAWNIGTDCRKQSLLHQPCIHSVEP